MALDKFQDVEVCPSFLVTLLKYTDDVDILDSVTDAPDIINEVGIRAVLDDLQTNLPKMKMLPRAGMNDSPVTSACWKVFQQLKSSLLNRSKISPCTKL